jgi:hypothetical protein
VSHTLCVWLTSSQGSGTRSGPLQNWWLWTYHWCCLAGPMAGECCYFGFRSCNYVVFCVSGTFHDLVVYPDMILLPKWFLMVKNPRHSRCYFHKLKPCCETLQLKYRVFLFSQHRICRLPRTGFGRHWRWPRHAISREAQRLQLSRQHPGWVGGVNSVWCSQRYRFFE